MKRLGAVAGGAWRNDLVRLVVLVLYYQAIIAALIVLYSGSRYEAPAFIYQAF